MPVSEVYHASQQEVDPADHADGHGRGQEQQRRRVEMRTRCMATEHADGHGSGQEQQKQRRLWAGVRQPD